MVKTEVGMIDGYYMKSTGRYVCKLRNENGEFLSDNNDNYLHLFECEYTLPYPTKEEIKKLTNKVKEAQMPSYLALSCLNRSSK